MILDVDNNTITIVAAALIVVSGIVGFIAGFFIGGRFGQVSGELRAIKSLKTRSHRMSRSSGSSESSSDVLRSH